MLLNVVVNERPSRLQFCALQEFLVIPNWLFQLAKSQTQLTLADVEKG